MNNINHTKNISIIVCCYNGENTISECLNSLKNQITENIEIEVILVDDGSKDKTAELIQQFLQDNPELKNPVFHYYRKENEGLSIARNFGFKKASGKYITYIDEDAVAYEDFATNIISTFNDNSETNCIGGTVELLNENNSFAKLIQYTTFSLYMNNPNAVIGTNMSFTSDFLKKSGGFQPEFTYRGDETALFRKNQNSIHILQAKDVKVKHQQPPNSKLYLKTRYENGYFSAAIDNLIKKRPAYFFRKILIAFLTLYLPFIILLGVFLTGANFIIGLLLLTYCAILFRRFILNNLFSDLINEYKRNKAFHGSEYSVLYLLYLTILGGFKNDFGYLKGYFKYKNYRWN
jgi:glycosyltransferase involved in cell wall biosynthesis